ncbi:MAG: hypothetical protein IKD08_03880 [Alphaproteobacteria bacterium]|nr:hypothetical protein [Alphaproteobacteria bacterium]
MKIRHLSFCLTIMAAAACSPVERNITWFGSDEKDAKELTDKAIVSLGEGNVEQAILQAEEALRKVPKYPYALMVAGVGYDVMGIPAKARRYYEDLIEINADGLSTIGNLRNLPPLPMNEVARQRLKTADKTTVPFTVKKQKDGSGKFAVNPNLPLPATAGSTLDNSSGVVAVGEKVFAGGDRNAVARFLTFKELAEDGLITRQEFAVRRNNNVGALLPFTKGLPAVGLERPTPSAKDVKERLLDLRNAFEMHSISAEEHEAERITILDAILPPKSLEKADQPNPPKDLLDGGTAVRRLEVLYSLGLITEDEKNKEQDAVEKLVQVGLNPKGFDTLSVLEEAETITAPAATAAPKQLLKTPAAKKTTKRKNPGVVTGRKKN